MMNIGLESDHALACIRQHIPFSTRPSVVTWNTAGSRHTFEYLSELVVGFCHNDPELWNQRSGNDLMRRAVASLIMLYPGDEKAAIAFVRECLLRGLDMHAGDIQSSVNEIRSGTLLELKREEVLNLWTEKVKQNRIHNCSLLCPRGSEMKVNNIISALDCSLSCVLPTSFSFLQIHAFCVAGNDDDKIMLCFAPYFSIDEVF